MRFLALVAVSGLLVGNLKADSFFDQTPVSAGLSLRLDASNVSTVNGGSISNGGFVDTWADTSGFGHNAMSSGARRAIWNSSVAGVGGRSTLTFDGNSTGSGDDYHFSFSPGTQPATDFTAFFVAENLPQSNASGSCCRPLIASDSTTAFNPGAFGFGLLRQNLAPNGLHLYTSESAGPVINNNIGIPYANDSQFHIYSVVRDALGISIFEDGDLVYNNSNPAEFQATLTELDYYIGGNRNSEARHFLGDIAEVFIYNRALSLGEQDTLGGFLAAKYELDTSFSEFPVPAPEPATIVLFGMTLAIFGAFFYRRHRRVAA